MTPSATAPARARSGTAPARKFLRAAPPPARRGHVDRGRLVNRLRATQAVRVVLITAPAGYGKTTLLEAWARSDPRPFRWLSPGHGPLAAARRRGELAAIAAAPERLGGPCVLVVDGQTTPQDVAAAHDLALIAETLPPGCLLVVASRAPAALPVGRLRAQHEVLELGARDLAMTHREALALLDGAGLGLRGAALDALMATSEGWPAALSLAAQTLTRAADPHQGAARFGGDDPFVADYVADELLAGLSPGLTAFLRRCSVLDVLEADLCDALVGGQGAAALLHELERSALPVVRVDRAAVRLRCHPLLRQVLLAELRRHEPGAHVRLHRRASGWFEDRDDLDAAIRHALAGEDLDRAGELLWRVAAGYAWDGRRAVLDGWLRAVPARAVQQHAALALTAAMSDLSRLALAEAAHRMTMADAVLDQAPATLRPSLRAGRTVLEAMTGRGGPAELREHAARAAALAGDAEPARALCHLLEGAAATLAGDPAGAADALEEGVRRGAVCVPGIAALCEAELALGALCAGDWEQGACLAERARSRADAIGLEDHPSLALVAAVAAFARAHRGRFAEARMDVELVDRLIAGRDVLPPWYGAQLALALARARLRLGDVPGARAQLAAARREARRLPGAGGLASWVQDAGASADAFVLAALDDAESLTAAELRVLRFLPSHLSFREIGGCLHVSANTIKSQAHAVYRKLGASSRSVAVERARVLGLLDAATAHSSGPEDGCGLIRA